MATVPTPVPMPVANAVIAPEKLRSIKRQTYEQSSNGSRNDQFEAATVARFVIGFVLRICPPTNDWVALRFNTCAMRW